MPLDPQLRRILDLLPPPVDYETVTLAELRFEDPSARPPVDTSGIESIDEATVASRPARVYRPVEHHGGVVVFFHGGGWVRGSLDTHHGMAARMAVESGCVVVSVAYRLAPECTFPGPLEDCYAATAWVADHAGELGADPARLAVAGDSAGGNLAAAVALLARERGGPAIAFQLLIYPATDVTFDYPSVAENGALGYLLTDAGMRWYMAQYVGGAPDVDWRAAPMQADDLTGLPPAFVVTAELDPLRDEGEAYGRRLQDAGVPTTIVRAPGMIHGFYGMPVDGALRVRAEVAAALRAALG